MRKEGDFCEALRRDTTHEGISFCVSVMASNEWIAHSIIAAGKYTPGVTSRQGLSAIGEVFETLIKPQKKHTF